MQWRCEGESAAGVHIQYGSIHSMNQALLASLSGGSEEASMHGKAKHEDGDTMFPEIFSFGDPSTSLNAHIFGDSLISASAWAMHPWELIDRHWNCKDDFVLRLIDEVVLH